MHELSLSYATVESALESIAELNPTSVTSITLRIGAFSGVAIEALRFSFPLAAAGTLLETANLIIEIEPVTVYCPACDRTATLESIQDFRCPICHQPTADIRAGNQLIIQSIEVETAEVPEHDHAHCGTP